LLVDLMLAASVAMQIAAAVLLVRYRKAREWLWVWIFLGLAVLLTLSSHLVLYFERLQHGHGATLLEAGFSLAGTAALLVAIGLVAPRLRSITRSREALRRSEERWERLVGSIRDVVFEIDTEGRYTGVFGGWLEEVGATAEDFVGRRPEDVFVPETAAVFSQAMAAALAGEASSSESRVEMPWGLAHYHTSLAPIHDASGTIIGAVGVARDMSSVRETERSLASEKAFAEMLIETANVLVVRVDAEGIVRLINQTAEEVTGYSRDELLGRDWFDVMMPRHVYPRAWEEFQASRAAGEVSGGSAKARGSRVYAIITKSGAERAVSWQYTDIFEDGEFAGRIAYGIDITESRRRAKELKHLATHDTLTGLPNRRSFENAVERAVARAHRGSPSALLFIDIDNFKMCNDTHGHAFGDRVLRDIGRMLQLQVREPDMVARIGGDEFGILLDGADLEDARIIAERVCVGMSGVDSKDVELDLSCGIASMDDSGGFEDFYTGADTAMYVAKGSDERVVVYEPGLTPRRSR
jgi:diguanylate cyclase (GGDEF)-like protein/PAS domain S-box-containing protein